MDNNGQSPFSLRPWPVGGKEPKTIAEFVARVNTLPGGFRELDEEKLRRKVRAKQRGEADYDVMDGSSDEDDEEDDSEEGKEKTAMDAREEFLRNLDSAHQSAMLALDFVSLLLSKENPVQAGTTLSPALRDLVGIGTLGASKLKDFNVTEAQKQDDLAVATGWRVMGINNMVDSAMSAAERLEKEVEAEAKYWADILAVSEDGWTVCALPNQPHTLGVRFGFAESAPEFRDNSVAPLLRNDDGSIKLGVGQVGGGSQRVRVTVKKNGKIIDQSPLPERTPDDAPLNDRVREARDTIFHQELWYEMNREARMLLAHEIRYDGPAIVWKQDGETEVVFTLEDLGAQDDGHVSFTEGIRSASVIYSLLKFFLFQSHRQNYHRRTSPSAAIRQADPNSTYNILFGLVARYDFFANVDCLASTLRKLVVTLHHAGISTASTSTSLSPPNPVASGTMQPRYTPTTELLWVQQLVSNLVARHSFVITPEARVWCQSRGFIRPSVGTYFYFRLSPPFPQAGQPRNPLETIYPASDPCPSVLEAIYYFLQASVRALAHKLATTAAERFPDMGIQWGETITGIEIKNNKGSVARLAIDIVDEKVVLRLETRWLETTTPRISISTWDSVNESAGPSMEEIVMMVMKVDV
ncbi:subunit 17 of mediator complex-domain-containing protein [Poronia punctata]|nr:subunit 17 of mediator complex-domain-containing protein [Poronia punctata]